MLVMNFGLHYKSEIGEQKLRQDMEQLSKDIDTISLTHLPKLFFLETVPQHFQYSPVNGYYQPGQTNASCHPLSDVRVAAEYDWRNKYIDEFLGNDPRVQIIRIAETLRDQSDAHVGYGQDCTHWCFQSGAMRYMIRKVYNALLSADNRVSPSVAYEGSLLDIDSMSPTVNTSGWKEVMPYVPDYSIYKDGTLLRFYDDRVVYYVENKTKRAIHSINVFLRRGWDLVDDVEVLTDPFPLDILPSGPALI
mmetsp:Transcript_21625/g.36222  ORF Transcript_21625/g.36222 Transcript_21625/m.36222 type:complete len:249 (+) Transcript_21625:587-1333(+)